MLQNMGITTVQMAGGEVVPALERGTIDGAEWAIPSHDILMGFHNITKYYYMPDMRQPPGIRSSSSTRRSGTSCRPISRRL